LINVAQTARLLFPDINLRWVFTSELFPEKTPEESDRFPTPHENRPKSEKPDGNKHHFFTRFTLLRREYSSQKGEIQACFTLGLGETSQNW